MLVGMDISSKEWNQAKFHQVHEANKWNKETLRWHGRANEHGMVVPKFYPQWLGFPILHGLNAFKVGFEYKPFSEVGTVEMEVSGVEE